MPKEKQTRKQWITKLRRDAVGPYFKVTVFFLFFVCLFVVVVFFLNTISGLAFMLVICTFQYLLCYI